VVRETKRVINAFSIYGYLQNNFPPQREIFFPTCLDSQMPSFTHYRREDVAKVRKKSINTKLFFDIF
jgi:hypothetical protein